MNIVILTGAGISAESGMGTFRDEGGSGLWSKFDPMKLATPEAFARDPETVQDFYNQRRRDALEALPNAAHLALARLEADLAGRGGRMTLVTQNIDDLHEKAGSQNVLHMHGELMKVRCNACHQVSEWREDVTPADLCPACHTLGYLRPHVVWFGEMPFHLDEIVEAIELADLFVAIGTSGSVYPAAGFVSEARDLGIRTAEINLEPSDNASVFDDRLYGPATHVVPQWVEELIAGFERHRVGRN